MDYDGRFIASFCEKLFSIQSESGSSWTSESVICDSVKGGDGVGVDVFLLVDGVDVEANAACACASISCFGKSCDGHSKWTQWKIYFYFKKESKENIKIREKRIKIILCWNV